MLDFFTLMQNHPINVKNLMLNAHLHAMMRTHFLIWTLGFRVEFNQGYSDVEFNVMYFQ